MSHLDQTKTITVLQREERMKAISLLIQNKDTLLSVLGDHLAPKILNFLDQGYTSQKEYLLGGLDGKKDHPIVDAARTILKYGSKPGREFPYHIFMRHFDPQLSADETLKQFSKLKQSIETFISLVAFSEKSNGSIDSSLVTSSPVESQYSKDLASRVLTASPYGSLPNSDRGLRTGQSISDSINAQLIANFYLADHSQFGMEQSSLNKSLLSYQKMKGIKGNEAKNFFDISMNKLSSVGLVDSFKTTLMLSSGEDKSMSRKERVISELKQGSNDINIHVTHQPLLFSFENTMMTYINKLKGKNVNPLFIGSQTSTDHLHRVYQEIGGYGIPYLSGIILSGKPDDFFYGLISPEGLIINGESYPTVV